MDALTQIDTWPVGRAVAAVIGPGGVLGTRGPTDRPFPLASVTKPLTALACLVAVEEGAIELDEPAGPPGSTVRHLLAHASGYAFDRAERAAAPGTRRIYSNAGFEALGAHVAAATGMPFAEYFGQAVCEPLGLAATALTGSPAYAATSTVADLTRVAAELLAPALLHPQTVGQATAVQFPGLSGVLPGYGRQADNDWGLGMEIRDSKSPHWTGAGNSPATFGHFGRSGTFLWVDPVARLACVVLTDTEFGDWAVRAWPPLSDAILTEAG
ncbi:MAG TPA: serine hydrolase domain-containing protein [Mycobacteriales bacterium]|nr:serine hydrolase domain-containing protein [Mycobacteriales bacterium]